MSSVEISIYVQHILRRLRILSVLTFKSSMPTNCKASSNSKFSKSLLSPLSEDLTMYSPDVGNILVKDLLIFNAIKMKTNLSNVEICKS